MPVHILLQLANKFWLYMYVIAWNGSATSAKVHVKTPKWHAATPIGLLPV